MRWSPFSLVALLAVLVAEVTALPTPQDGSSELSLERLAVTKPKAPTEAKASSVKALKFKKSSKAYRNAAQKGKNAPPKRMPKGKDADHIFEAQTMWHAARKGGHSSTTLGSVSKAVTDRINDPENVGLLDPKTNRAKGRAYTTVQSGKTHKDKNVAEYLKQTKAAGKATAADVNEILEAHSIRFKGSHVWKPEPMNMEVPYPLTVL